MYISVFIVLHVYTYGQHKRVYLWFIWLIPQFAYRIIV